MIASLLVIVSLMNPLGLPWDEKQSDPPEVEHYKYWFGSVPYGRVVYNGSSSILGVETELLIEFSSKKISIATLILGPSGLNESNCVRKYKRVNSLLNEKYGESTSRSLKRDPMIEELLYDTECYAILRGLQEFKTTWKTEKWIISSLLWGDEESLFIEIEYKSRFVQPKFNETDKINTLRRL